MVSLLWREAPLMYFESDKQTVLFLYHLVTSKTKKVHETMLCEGWWKKHKADIFFPTPNYVHEKWDKDDKSYYWKKAKSLLGTNHSMDFWLYLLTDYEAETDFMLTLRRQEFWLMGMLVNSATWKLEGRESWFPKMSIHLVEIDKAENPHLFYYWEMNYKNHFTNLKEIRKGK